MTKQRNHYNAELKLSVIVLMTNQGYSISQAMEAAHRQFRKTSKKGGDSNENSQIKPLYIGFKQASKKWTMPISN